MKPQKLSMMVSAISLMTASAVSAEDLFIYNWTDYTAPELIESFEKETGIDVTIDTFDSSETLLAKLKQGGAGYDITVVGHNYVPILVSEGLIQPINAPDLNGGGNIAENWADPEWDAGNVYTVPWNWGTTSFAVDTSVYDGDIDTYEIFFNPPEGLSGSLGLLQSSEYTIQFAQLFLGLDRCNENPEEMQQVLDLLLAQKEHVKLYSSAGVIERMISGDTAMHQIWNGDTMRARGDKPTLQYAYPKEGVIAWFDNLVVPTGAQNKDNAIKFIEFMLRPENAALQSNYSGFGNGISGNEEMMDPTLSSAPEIVAPADVKLYPTAQCSEEAIRLIDRVWTKLLN
ncbi:spermidine/putrescine ABC transporter, spermidine/putrescine-binding protein [Rhodobacteraceae bacterium KLH11]|nr:spermidine/putrescine ABC transporter, spermidine/putrescine-binding protein [Rhodobacteraceae bacterium KLH11]